MVLDEWLKEGTTDVQHVPYVIRVPKGINKNEIIETISKQILFFAF